MYKVITENTSLEQNLLTLTKNIMDFSVKIVGIYVQKTEEKSLKKTLKKIKDNVTVTKQTKLKGYGSNHYKKCKELLTDYLNENKKLLKALRGSKLEDKDFLFYQKKIDENRNKLQKKIKELHDETVDIIKKYCVLSIETIHEVEYDMKLFKVNVTELTEVTTDSINDLFSLLMSVDNKNFQSLCRSISFHAVVDAQKIITEYASYPNRLLSFFDNLN